MLGYTYGKRFGSIYMYTPTFLKHSHSTSIHLWRWNRQSAPKHRRIKFRRQGITQKKTCNIQNMAKVWNQEGCTRCVSFHQHNRTCNVTVITVAYAQPWCNKYTRMSFILRSAILLDFNWEFQWIFYVYTVSLLGKIANWYILSG